MMVSIDLNKKTHVELGAGYNRRDVDGWNNIGIDIVPSPVVDIICNLGFDRMPLNDDSVHLVQSYDVLEHIPKCLWVEEYITKKLGDLDHVKRESAEQTLKSWISETNKKIPEFFGDEVEIKVKEYKRITPLIHTINEVYRILVNGGKFVVEVPISNWALDRDPTHITRFSEDWWHYFKKEDNLYYTQQLVTTNFVVNKNEKINNGNTLRTELIAVKNNSEPILASTINREPVI